MRKAASKQLALITMSKVHAKLRQLWGAMRVLQRTIGFSDFIKGILLGVGAAVG
jgi:hypothetical protein